MLLCTSMSSSPARRPLGWAYIAAAVALGACSKETARPPAPRAVASTLPDRPQNKPVELAKDGKQCESDEECESAHCSNHLCCLAGDCCVTVEDCPAPGSEVAACDDPQSCQGTRGTLMCSPQFRCRARDGVEDDRGCGPDIESDDCGPYRSLYCNGKEHQVAARCPSSCAADSECDDDAHCAQGKCVPDLSTAENCQTDGECATHHCSHGVCCESGDCCLTADDCDAEQYATAATCDEPDKCQGTRGAAACDENRCTVQPIDDDSACDRTVVANDCGEGADVKCRGGAEQAEPPACAMGSCRWGNGDCSPAAFCWQGTCLPDQPNGESCNGPEACQSGNCQNNVCCEAGDCCTSDAQCPAIKSCEDRLKCQGKSQQRHCDVNQGVCVQDALVDDDSGCTGMQSTRECGRNLSPLCGDAQEQADAPACSRCINLPRCDQWTQQVVPSSTSGTTTVPGCMHYVNDIPVGCELGAGCNSGSGICF